MLKWNKKCTQTIQAINLWVQSEKVFSLQLFFYFKYEQEDFQREKTKTHHSRENKTPEFILWDFLLIKTQHTLFLPQ